MHAAVEVSFDLGKGTVVIGRRLGSAVVVEPFLSERVEGDIAIYVRVDDDQLQECVLASAHYDRAQDERD